MSDSCVGILEVSLRDDGGNEIEFYSSAHLCLPQEDESKQERNLIGSFYCEESVDMSECLNRKWTLFAEVYTDSDEEIRTEEIAVTELAFGSVYQVRNRLPEAKEVTLKNGKCRITGVLQNTYYTEIQYECPSEEREYYFRITDESGKEFYPLGGSSEVEAETETGTWDIEQVSEDVKELTVMPSVVTDGKEEPMGKIMIDLE